MKKPRHSIPKRIYSARSQASVQKQWRLESEQTACRGNIVVWEKKLATAKEGKERQLGQIAAGHGHAHSILAEYLKDIAQAEEMISSFKQQSASIHAQIDALVPDAVRAAERAERQNELAGLVVARLENDKKLDLALQSVRQLLGERKGLTSKISALAEELDFSRCTNSDGERFEDLLRMLPAQGMARVSEKWVTWFLGSEPDRTPREIRGSNFVLPETLYSHNCFRPGDRPSLSKEEWEKFLAELNRPADVILEMMPVNRRRPQAEEVPTGTIQWGLLRP